MLTRFAGTIIVGSLSSANLISNSLMAIPILILLAGDSFGFIMFALENQT